MFKIVKKDLIAPDNYSYWVEATDIAQAYGAGQFIILRIDEKGERIPLTIVDTDLDKGLIRIIFSVVGATSHKLSLLDEGGFIKDIVGPLGNKTHIENYGTAVVVGGGVGIAPIYPITRALQKAGNNIVSILGARTKDLLILKDDMEIVSEKLLITSDDGSIGTKGFVTDALEQLILDENQPVDFVLAVGPLVMMRAVSDLTKKYGIKTMVSLNTMMVDGTGMCGCCRCTVGSETKFTCVHGPEFDAHKVDFDELVKKQGMFHKKEKKAYKDIKDVD